jgi:D-alanyl-D-alanine carboxypeptidase/D-alanyl-D-alanine-endopeptidase (penicillin-binding protein 4)
VADSWPPARPAKPLVQFIPSEVVKIGLEELSQQGVDVNNQGIYIESLDGSRIVASHNADVLFNPASVAKLATSTFALWKLGPNSRFATRAAYQGSWNSQMQRIQGDLMVDSDGDPLFRMGEARVFASRLRQAGVRSVSGDLAIAGPFCLNGNYSPEESAQRMEKILRSAGIQIQGTTRLENRDTLMGTRHDQVPSANQPTVLTHSGESGPLILEHRSVPLRDILWHQNAHSVNVIADRLGASLGGPSAMERFLQQEVGISLREMYFTRNSGLDANGLTPRATVKLTRFLYQWLQTRGMNLLDILPAAGVDSGTLSDRFLRPEYRGCVIAKTGTQSSWNEGVSVLAGMLSTRKGQFFFAIYNSHGDIRFYRRWQDLLVKRFLEESGGGVPWKEEAKEPIDIYSAEWNLQISPTVSRHAQSAE